MQKGQVLSMTDILQKAAGESKSQNSTLLCCEPSLTSQFVRFVDRHNHYLKPPDAILATTFRVRAVSPLPCSVRMLGHGALFVRKFYNLCRVCGKAQSQKRDTVEPKY
jgi:hypothetical protein